MLRKSMDGNEAAAYASYAFTEVATIYPITPSSPMANHVDEWAAKGKKNLFGMPVKLMEMQAEAGACAAMQGALEAGALGTQTIVFCLQPYHSLVLSFLIDMSLGGS